MRAPLFILFLTAALGSLADAAPPQAFPYRAGVTADDVYVRSGPGDSYYPTAKLKAGQEVEVYRHDPGGWCAIRPPEGSFSWVSGRQLDLGDKNLATVKEDRVAARVGSRFSDVRDVIQVRLHRGELVEVLDAKQTGPSTTTATNTWYKIAPPAGEFRWISAKFLDTDGGLSKPAAVADASVAVTPLPASPQPLVDPRPTVPRRIAPEQFQAELNAIDLDLSTMVVEEPSVWELGELRVRSEALVNQADSAAERGRARTLVNKISRFQDIKQRYTAINQLHDNTTRIDRQLSRVTPRVSATALSADPNGRYDATGKLTSVPSAKLGAPQYALVDEKGNVRCYVSPAPGVNLRHYLGRDVGITGTRGYMPEQKANHLMARHVNILDASSGGTVLR